MSKPMLMNKEIRMNPGEFIVSKTDTKGKITYCNEIFIKMSGYCEVELSGKPHNIVRHQDMPKAVFKLLWERLQNKEEIFAYVKNLSKNGTYYWVFANVTASLDDRENIIGYYSVRIKPNDQAIETISSLYQQMVQIEQREGVNASLKFLNKLLEEKGVSYDEFIISLQG
jgi:PAS domain S-box-containing protein